MMAYMADVFRFMLRLPADLHAELKQWAVEEDRSLHSLLIHIIRVAVRERHKEGLD